MHIYNRLLACSFSIVFCFSLFAEDLKDFELPIYKKDKTYSFKKDFKKEKLLINFWASWCTACIKELKELEELKKKYSDRVEFVAINAGEHKKKIKKFLRKYKFSYLILEDKGKAYSKSMSVLELPRTLVVDKKGKILFTGNRPPKSL